MNIKYQTAAFLLILPFLLVSFAQGQPYPSRSGSTGQSYVAADDSDESDKPLDDLAPAEPATPLPESPEKVEPPEEPGTDQPSKELDGSDKPDGSGKSDGTEKPDGPEKSDAPEKSDDPEKSHGSDKPDKSENQKTDKSQQSIKSIRELFKRESDATIQFSKRAKDFVSIFQPVIDPASKSIVKIMSGNKQVALGIVVDDEGHILTKASELEGKIACKISADQTVSATVLGISPETDLALLSVKANGLVPVKWGHEPPPVVGQWVATPNGEDSLLDVGVVSVNARPIPQSSPFIGIVMMDLENKNGVKITTVVANSPADEADLLVGDIITKIDSVEIKDIESLRSALGQYDPYDRITLTVKRAGKLVDIKLTLAERDKASPLSNRSIQQNSMGSVLSRRRKDFPLAFQHDSMLTSKTCGGPVVNLDGDVVGINIARAGRVSSLALPVETILPILQKLKTGELAPQLVNQEKIKAIDSELTEIATKLKTLPQKQQTLDTQYQVEKAKQAELERILKDVQGRLKVIEMKSQTLGTELDSIKHDLTNMEKVQEKLESDRHQLATGIRE